ncbi:hypothetical protein VTK56DRAFT_2992 [Thermocarpiscus australiensis]
MSLFSGSTHPGFTPLFRLLEDFDNYSREVQGNQGNGRHPNRQSRAAPLTFSPRFDVRETEHAYELHGELPGVERENVHIEFTEPQTIVIRGHIERSYGPKANANNQTNSHRVTVEDAKDDEAQAAKAGSGGGQEVQKAPEQQVNQQTQQQAPEPKYWLWERSVGEFSRTFSFPARVDHDGVTAGLKDGILSVTVPKAKPQTKRIAIN